MILGGCCGPFSRIEIPPDEDDNHIPFYSQNTKPEKIVIGQRLGKLLSDKNNPFSKLLLKNYNDHIPIEISTDRRTAAIGAAYKAHENIE